MIRVGIVGLGAVARAHLSAYRLFSNRCEVVAVVEPNDDSYRAHSELYGVSCVPRFRSLEALLQRGEVDLLSITTPPFLHADEAIAAMRRGINVLCEEPMCLSLQDSLRMIEARDQNQVMLSVVSQLRFQDGMQRLHDAIRNRVLGEPLYTRVDSYWWRNPSYCDPGWRASRSKGGGGVCFTQGIHHLDLIIWMFGLPQSVFAVTANVAHDNIESEDIGCAVLRYPKSVVQFTGTLMAHGERQRMEVHCERGMISSSGDVYVTLNSRIGTPSGRDSNLEAEILSTMQGLPPLEHQYHAGQIDNVLSVLEGDPEVQLAVSAEDAYRVLELLNAVYRSANEQHQVELVQAPLPI